jgi:hypothetical protein
MKKLPRRTCRQHLLYEWRVALKIPRKLVPRVLRHLPSRERCQLFVQTHIYATVRKSEMGAGEMRVAPYRDKTACTDM